MNKYLRFSIFVAVLMILVCGIEIRAQQANAFWKVGNKVEAQWSKNQKYYAATVIEVDKDRCKVHYLDEADSSGDEWRDASQIRPYKEWTWVNAAGETKTVADLQNIILKHQQWLVSGGKEGEQANLSGARFNDAALSKVNFERANLEHVSFLNATFKGANFNGANLKNAVIINCNLAPVFLRGADLSGALLSGDDLSGSDLSDSNFSRTWFIGTKLTGAFLLYSNLSDASLKDADLSSAAFDGVNLKNVYYEPKKNPETRYIAGAVNLETLKYSQMPDALVTLRKDFKDSGFREQENKITYALKRSENELLWMDAFQTKCEESSDPTHQPCATEKRRGRDCENGICEGKPLNILFYYLNLIFFDWTVRYGMQPERALIMLICLWFICSIIYYLFIHYPGKDGIYLIKTRKHKTPVRTRGLRIIPYTITSHRKSKHYWRNLFRREWRILRLGMFFSLMTTFNLGFKEFDVGRWLNMLTKREYELIPRHWTRTVAGFQSLVSLYLIAMWILTHFGQPFE